MSDDILPEWSPLAPYVLPATHAESRPGPVVPEPTATTPDWRQMGRRFDDALRICRELWHTVQVPRGDPLYHRVLPDLRTLEVVLRKAIVDRPDDEVAAEMLAEVRKYLPVKPRGHSDAADAR